MSLLRLAARSTPFTRRAIVCQRNALQLPFRAGYSAAAGLSRETIEQRVLEVLKGFEKVQPSKVCLSSLLVSVSLLNDSAQITPSASFTQDLGLDSLDVVEVVMAVEEVRPNAMHQCLPLNRSRQ